MLYIKDKLPVRPLPLKRVVVSDFSLGQITEKENDKIPVDSSSLLENVVLFQGNIDTRAGSKILSSGDFVGISVLKRSGTDVLIGFDYNNKKIVRINRTNGDKTETDAPDLPNVISATNGQGKLFFNYGSGFAYYDVDTDTITSLSGATGDLCAYSYNRLWVAGDDGVKYSTIGVAEHSGDNFNPSLGTYDTTTGRYEYGISHGGIVQTGDMRGFTAMLAVGKHVVLWNEDGGQIHALPDADFTTYIDPERTTLVSSFGFGVKTKDAVIELNKTIYFVNDEGFFQMSLKGNVKPIKTNDGFLKQFDWGSACLGYNKKLNAILISGKHFGVNDITLCYFIDYGSFTYFTGMIPVQWTQTEGDTYYLDVLKKDIVVALNDEYKDDNGIAIKYLIRFPAIDGGIPEYYKRTREVFVDVVSYGDNSVRVEMFHDRLFGGEKPPTAVFDIDFDTQWAGGEPVFSFGNSVFGGGLPSTKQKQIEKKVRLKNRQKFAHIEIEVKGVAVNKISFRRIVLTYQEMPKKIKDLSLFE